MSPIASAGEAVTDIYAALRSYNIAFVFGWQDVAQRYRRSRVGAFWITISVGIMIGALGLLFGTLFQIQLRDFLPFVAVGLILWTFTASMVNEGCTAFIDASSIILQVRLPLFTHVLRLAWRNLTILAHNLVILPFVFLIMQVRPTPELLLVLPALALMLLNLTWMALILAILSARFRDIIQAIQNLMQVVFFITPIVWMPQTMLDRAPRAVLELNPFYHLLAIARDPLLGHPIDPTNWLVSIGLAVVGWLVALLLFGRSRRRIPYWL